MRFSSALVLGAASVATGQMDQRVLGGDSDSSSPYETVKPTAEGWMKPFEDTFSEMTSDAKALWDEVTMLMPDAVKSFKKTVESMKPKPHTRRPDHTWDNIVKGAELQSMWVEKNGEKHRKIGGNLENYNLRTKKVDPSALGVDTVKQYSGYLDDEANDKHLFYCKSIYSSNDVVKT
jgi:cathepsin A (carboxypeptidase C)